jgi:hypothetical protein
MTLTESDLKDAAICPQMWYLQDRMRSALLLWNLETVGRVRARPFMAVSLKPAAYRVVMLEFIFYGPRFYE